MNESRPAELGTIAAADDLVPTSLRPDETLPYTTIWVVKVGDGLCVRSSLRLAPR